MGTGVEEPKVVAGFVKYVYIWGRYWRSRKKAAVPHHRLELLGVTNDCLKTDEIAHSGFSS